MKYQDKDGNEYVIELTIGSAKKLKQAEGVDLLDPQQIIEVLTNPITAIDVLYCVTKDAELKPAEDFGASFDGEAAEKAIDALERAIINFTPARQRAALKEAITKSNDVIKQANEAVASQLSSKDLDELFQQGLEERMQEWKQKLSGSKSGA